MARYLGRRRRVGEPGRIERQGRTLVVGAGVDGGDVVDRNARIVAETAVERADVMGSDRWRGRIAFVKVGVGRESGIEACRSRRSCGPQRLQKD